MEKTLYTLLTIPLGIYSAGKTLKMLSFYTILRFVQCLHKFWIILDFVFCRRVDRGTDGKNGLKLL